MKVTKITLILGLFLLPVFSTAQENTDIVTKINENSITFAITDISLDTVAVSSIKNMMEKEITKQLEQSNTKSNKQTKSENNIKKKISANDIVSDDKYMYALNTRVVYDDDYGPYYYTEWSITQYSISSGEEVRSTVYMEGLGKFSTFKELEAQKDFGPVKRCKLAQLAFQAMYKQENLKQENK